MRIWVLVLLILLSGCKAKNKVTERKAKKEQIEVIADKLEKVSELETFDIVESNGSEVTEITDNTKVEIEADSTGKVVRKVEKTDSGFIETFIGVKKVTVSTDKKETVSKDTTVTEKSYLRDSVSVKKDNSVIRIKNETKERKTDVEIRSTSTWFWLILLILAMFVLWLNRKRIGMWF